MCMPGLSMMQMQQVDAVSGLSVSVFPASAKRTQSSSGGVPIVLTTPNVTASAVGGSGSYTYAWARISGDAAITAGSPAAATTLFSGTVNADDTITATFRVTATDTVTGATATADVVVTLHHVSLL